MCRDCILAIVLFLPLYLNLYNGIQTELPFTKVLLTKTDETNDASGIVSISFKSWLLFCGPDHLGGLSSVSPALSSLQLNRSIILLFSELMEKEPCHHLVRNCLHSTFAVEQLPIHFLRVSGTEKRNVEKSSITVSVSDVFFLITYQIHLDETKLMTLFHIF